MKILGVCLPAARETVAIGKTVDARETIVAGDAVGARETIVAGDAAVGARETADAADAVAMLEVTTYINFQIFLLTDEFELPLCYENTENKCCNYYFWLLNRCEQLETTTSLFLSI